MLNNTVSPFNLLYISGVKNGVSSLNDRMKNTIVSLYESGVMQIDVLVFCDLSVFILHFCFCGARNKEYRNK
jgi:hypothetical protein